MKKNVLIFMLMMFSNVYADGRSVGNGGIGVSCDENISILDFTNGKLIWGHSYNLLDEGSFEDIRHKVLNRWLRLDPERAVLYALETRNFVQKAKFLTGVTLQGTNDTGGYIAIPNDCEIVQIAIQKSPRFPEESRYYIDSNYWSMLDEKNKVGLMFHELLYSEAIALGRDDSYDTRYLNSLIHSDVIAVMSLEDYSNRLLASGIYKLDTLGDAFSKPLPREFWDGPVVDTLRTDGFIRSVTLGSNSTASVPLLNIDSNSLVIKLRFDPLEPGKHNSLSEALVVAVRDDQGNVLSEVEYEASFDSSEDFTILLDDLPPNSELTLYIDNSKSDRSVEIISF